MQVAESEICSEQRTCMILTRSLARYTGNVLRGSWRLGRTLHDRQAKMTAHRSFELKDGESQRGDAAPWVEIHGFPNACHSEKCGTVIARLAQIAVSRSGEVG